MALISHGVFALALVWTLWQIVHVRRQVYSGAIVVPPLVAATRIFALCIVAIALTDASPLHLVWLFPCSFFFGIVFFPVGTKLILLFLAPLARPASLPARRAEPL